MSLKSDIISDMGPQTAPDVIAAPGDGDSRDVAARPLRERVLLWLEALLALGAIAGAVGIMAGDLLGDAIELLPFESAMFAGMALLLINGLLPIAVIVDALTKQRWGRWGHALVGVALMGWVGVQVYFLGLPIHWLQALYFVWGLAILVLALQLRRDDS